MKSGARLTEVIGSTIEDGADGTASYLIDIVSGNAAMITGNTLQKGPQAENSGTAINIAGSVTAAAPGYRISDNRFRSDNPHQVAFVRNRTALPAVLEANQIEGDVVPLVGPGTVDAEAPAQAVRDDRPKAERANTRRSRAGRRPAAWVELEAKLRMLKRFFEDELINDKEYAAKKAELLKDF